MVSNWVGTSYMSSLIGGFLADAYWGRYMAAAVFLVIFLVGMVMLTLAAALPGLRGSPGVLYLALYIVALGYGGYQPCISSLGADQFDKEDLQEQGNSTRFFNWYYMSMMLGAIVSATLLVYVEEEISWGLGFGLSTAAAGFSSACFFAGARSYRHQKVAGNPMTRVAQVLTAAMLKLRVQVPSESSRLYEVDSKHSIIKGSRKIQHTDDFRFLDRAAVEIQGDSEKNPWRLCTVTQVEEVKCLVRLLPVWATSIIFSALYTQVSILFVVQGSAMNTKLGRFRIPAASLSTFCTLSVLVCGPVYERFLVPVARKLTGNHQGFTNLQRMGIGLITVTSSMICAGIVEVFRLRSLARGSRELNVFWQLPQYFLMGLSEVFGYIGQLDFFYEQSPDAIRGLGVALSQCSFALGNYLSSLLVILVEHVTSDGSRRVGWIPHGLNKGHLDYFFWLLASLGLFNLVVHLICAKRFKCVSYN